MEVKSSIDSGDPLIILLSVFRHIQARALAPNDDDLDLIRAQMITLYLGCNA